MAMTTMRNGGRRAASAMTRWAGSRLLSMAMTRRSGLAGVSVVPKKLSMPLRRDGLDPLPALGELRDSQPVAKLRRMFGINVWLVSGYEQARAVLADTANYSNDIRPFTGTDNSTAEGAIGGLGFTDPPEHTRLRALLTPEFTKRRLARLQPSIERIVEERLDALAAGPPVVDLAAEFSFPIPFLVICELLGLEPADRDRFRELGGARFDLADGVNGTFDAMSESREFLLEVVRKQRLSPGDGLLGALLDSHGEAVDEVQLAGLADGVFTGGFETSASMLSLGTLTLMRDPDGFALIRKDDDAVDGIVEELLRYLSVVQIAFPRFARRDLDLFGQQIKAGDVVVCSLSGADRDPVFGDSADHFDPRRAPQSHLAFGHGFHRCVGSELARMELRAAFRGLARRFPDITLAIDPSELSFRKLSIVYGLDSLPVRLNERAR